MLRKIKQLETRQNKDLSDVISLESFHELGALPRWGAIPAYQEDECVKPAIFNADNPLDTPYEFWATSVKGRNLAIIFEGVINVPNHGLKVDEYYYLSSKKAGGITLTKTSVNQRPCLYVLDEKQIKLQADERNLAPPEYYASPEYYDLIVQQLAELNEQTIAGLRERVDALAEDDTVAQDIQQLKEELQQQIDRVIEKVPQPGADPEALNQLEQGLQQQIDLLESKAQTAQKIAELKEELQQRIAGLEDKNQTESSNNGAALEELAVKVAKLETDSQAAPELTDFKAEIQQQIDNSIAQLKEIGELGKAIEELRGQVTKPEDLAQIEENIAQITQNLQQLEQTNNSTAALQELSDKVTQLETSAPDLTQIQKQIDTLSQQVAAIDPEKLPQLEDIAKLGQELEKLSQINDLGKTLTELTDRVAQLETAAPDLTELKSQIQGQIDLLAQQLPEPNALPQIKEAVDKLTQGLDQLNQADDNTETALQELGDRVASFKGDLQGQVDLLQEQVSQNLSRTEENLAKLGQTDETLQNLSDTIAQLGQDQQRIELDLAAIKQELQQKIDLLTQQISDSSSEDLSQLKEAVAKLTQDLSQLSQDNTAPQELTDKIAEQEHTIKGLTAEITELDDHYKAEITRLEDLIANSSAIAPEFEPRYIDLRTADYSQFPTNQTETIQSDLIEGNAYRIERSPQRGMEISRIDKKADNRQVLAFLGFTGDEKRTFEAIFGWRNTNKNYSIKGFWGLGDKGHDSGFTNAHSEYFYISSWFSKGTFYGAYGKNNYRVNHANLSLQPGLDWCKFSFVEAGKSARIVALKSEVVTTTDVKAMFAPEMETKNEVSWSGSLLLPQEVLGAIALRETENAILNVLAVSIT